MDQHDEPAQGISMTDLYDTLISTIRTTDLSDTHRQVRLVRPIGSTHTEQGATHSPAATRNCARAGNANRLLQPSKIFHLGWQS
eukprot:203438-Chlamydomonas_euryale.AAC.2